MKRRIVVLGIAATLAAAGVIGTMRRSASGTQVAVQSVQAAASPVVAAAGRVEPISEELRIGAELNGKLKEVRVEEGQHVELGQIIAVLENADYAARVSVAEASLAQQTAVANRVENGSRSEERLEAEAAVNEARAVLDNTRAEYERRSSLFRSGDIAKSDLDRAEREVSVAKARFDAAVQRKTIADNASRAEDRERARADVQHAQAQLQEARALLAKTIVRSPINGVVLRKHLKAGESVSDQRDTPIVTIADDSRLRVRADVDEADIAKVRVGQKAYVTAGAYGDRRFQGSVVRISRLLGKKNVRTDDPTERVDTKVLETLIELNPNERLPSGLRVDAFIETAQR